MYQLTDSGYADCLRDFAGNPRQDRIDMLVGIYTGAIRAVDFNDRDQLNTFMALHSAFLIRHRGHGAVEVTSHGRLVVYWGVEGGGTTAIPARESQQGHAERGAGSYNLTDAQRRLVTFIVENKTFYLDELGDVGVTVRTLNTLLCRDFLSYDHREGFYQPGPMLMPDGDDIARAPRWLRVLVSEND